MTQSLFGAAGLASANEPELEGVGFWRRALARVIDLLVHFIVGLAVGITAGILVALGAALYGTSPDPALARMSEETPLTFLAALLGGTTLHILSEGLHGSTLGKRLCGIIVIDEDGGPATLYGALKRSVAFYVDALVFGLVAAHKMSQSPKRQRIGDLWANTMVVRIADLDRSKRPSGLRFLGALSLALIADGFMLLLGLASRTIL